MTDEHLRMVLRVRHIEPGDRVRVEWDRHEWDDRGVIGVFPMETTTGHLVEYEGTEIEIIADGAPFKLEIPAEWINEIRPESPTKTTSRQSELLMQDEEDVFRFLGVASLAEAVHLVSFSTDPEVWIAFDQDGMILGRGEVDSPDVWSFLHFPFSPTTMANGITQIEQEEVLATE